MLIRFQNTDLSNIDQDTSILSLALNKLGIKGYSDVSDQDHKAACLRLLQVSGNFNPEVLWQALNGIMVENSEDTFKQLWASVKKASAEKSPDEFNVELFLKNFGNYSGLNEDQMMDLLVYLAQNSFGRKLGQERFEIDSQEWMREHSDQYLEYAKTFGLINRITPECKEYDAALILGATRVGLMARFIDYLYVVEKYNINVKGEVLILTGNRPIFLPLDGINFSLWEELENAYREKIDIDTIEVKGNVLKPEDLEIDKKNLLEIAKHEGANLKVDEPFIEDSHKSGIFYFNYTDDNEVNLTEYIVARNLVKKYWKDSDKQPIIVNDEVPNCRPTTASTAKAAAQLFIKDIQDGKYGDQKKFIFLVETCQPSVMSQSIEILVIFNKALEDAGLNDYEVNIDGVGFSCKLDINNVASTMAAELAQRCVHSLKDLPIESIKEHMKSLFYQTRAVDVTPFPAELAKFIEEDLVDTIGDSDVLLKDIAA